MLFTHRIERWRNYMTIEEIQPKKRKDISLHKHYDAISVSASNLKSILSQEYASTRYKNFNILKEEANKESAQAQCFQWLFLSKSSKDC